MKVLGKLYIQVLIAMGLAIALGLLAPEWAVKMKPLGTAFIALLKMVLGPIIFFTVVHGIAHVGDFRRLGRIGVKTLVYFEVVSSLAMAVGFIVVSLVRPGDGLHARMGDDLAAGQAATVNAAMAGGSFNLEHFLLSIIPKTLASAFVDGDILPVLFVSILVGLALAQCAKPDWVGLRLLNEGQSVIFKLLGYIMRLSPLGAFGAMSAAVGSFGSQTLLYLLRYILTYYASVLIFIFLVLGSVAALAGFSILKILRVIKEEAIIAMGTASSEAAFPKLVAKLTQAGCDEAVVGFVLPAGYSFNIDGACLYMACGLGFLAQATDTSLSWGQSLSLLGVMLLTSKGGAGAAGGAVIKLAATLESVRVLPLGALGLLFGIDRVLAIATSTTNVIGNSVAVFVICRWERLFDRERFDACLKPAPAAHAERTSTPHLENSQ
ncbi:cation:dicarboxylase symporter family transporter [Pseudomonas sp. dw_358]|uniref:cation:dicarboxylate symporter family transporter n=1 Tax=Pseudomonas sp. dw_358 TaxID=2720083 RepID=UPI001BD63FED|nr:cation:dicarboxylase symporter family transporter [Pseudomonas sp. dw_358]